MTHSKFWRSTAPALATAAAVFGISAPAQEVSNVFTDTNQDIRRIEVSVGNGSAVHLDNLQFSTAMVPEPTSALLLSVLVLVGSRQVHARLPRTERR